MRAAVPAAMLCHMLLLGGRSPNKILYSHASGRVWQTDLMPTYDASGTLERNEPVPFRLTRNMVAFFSMFGVDGIFVTSLVAAAQASWSRRHPSTALCPTLPLNTRHVETGGALHVSCLGHTAAGCSSVCKPGRLQLQFLGHGTMPALTIRCSGLPPWSPATPELIEGLACAGGDGAAQQPARCAGALLS